MDRPRRWRPTDLRRLRLASVPRGDRDGRLEDPPHAAEVRIRPRERPTAARPRLAAAADDVAADRVPAGGHRAAGAGAYQALTRWRPPPVTPPTADGSP